MSRFPHVVVSTFVLATFAAIAGCAQPTDDQSASEGAAATAGSQAPALGEYALGGKGRWGQLTVRKVNAAGFDFTLSVGNEYGGYNTGDVAGSAKGKDGAFTYEASDCKLSFRVAGPAITVAQDGRCDMGVNVVADGVYTKKPAVPSLCAEGEQVVFSCQSASQKILSICAHDDAIQYRFGSAGRSDLQLPAAMAPIASKPEAAEGGFITLAGPGAGGGYATFHNGEYDYTVFSMDMSKGLDGEGRSLGTENESGVVVLEGGKRISFVKCAGDVKSELPSNLIAESPGAFDVLLVP